MMFQKRIVSAFIIIAIMLSGAFYSLADSGGAMPKVITEYMDVDLMQPLGEIIETAASVGEKLDIKAKSVVLLEPKTGTILYENNSHEKLSPASVTKVMSLLLIMEAIDSGKLSTETVITASEHACSMGGSQIWLEPNETMTVDELLKAAVIASANDATVALAEAVFGSEESFVSKMNEKAAELSLQDTHFINATGLDDNESNLTSAYDVAVMAAELLKHTLIKKYSTVWMDTLRGGKSQLVNTNKLVRFYEGATGLKTGTTSKAGHCLAASAHRNGMDLVAVVMGGESSNDRFNGARKLLDYGFANWEFLNIIVSDENLTGIPVKGGIAPEVSAIATEEKNVLVPKGQRDNVVQEITMEIELMAPVEKGQQIGSSRIVLKGKELGVIPIVSSEAVPKMTFLYSLKRIFKSLLTL
ncbi:MAG: D-alanyl-D-alanine carboxypeptidase family protein [Oscillospiraceae bacterium]